MYIKVTEESCLLFQTHLNQSHVNLRVNKEVKDSENFPHQQPQFYCIEWKTLQPFVNISSIFSIKTLH